MYRMIHLFLSADDDVARVFRDVHDDLGDRAALALYSVLVNITVYTDIPAVLEKYKKMVTDVSMNE